MADFSGQIYTSAFVKACSCLVQVSVLRGDAQRPNGSILESCGAIFPFLEIADIDSSKNTK